MGGINGVFKIPRRNFNDNQIQYIDYVINIDNNNIKIYKPNHTNPVGIDVVLTPIDSINEINYIKYNLNDNQKKIINMLLQLPIKLKFICYSEGFVLDNNNNIVTIILNENKTAYEPIFIKPNIIDGNNVELLDDFKLIIEKLDLGEDMKVDNFIISSDIWKKCLSDSSLIETLDDNVKDIYIKLLMYNQKIDNSEDGGFQRVKNSNAGFVNKLFMIGLSGFTFGIIVSIIIIIIKKYV